MSLSPEVLSEKIQTLLSPEQLREVEDFVDFLLLRGRERQVSRDAARVAPRPTTAAGENEIDALFERLARMPVLDSRTADDIVGYDRNGLPQ